MRFILESERDFVKHSVFKATVPLSGIAGITEYCRYPDSAVVTPLCRHAPRAKKVFGFKEMAWVPGRGRPETRPRFDRHQHLVRSGLE